MGVFASRALKVAAAYVLYYSGIMDAWARRALRRKVLVLMYHRVLTEDEMRGTASHPAIIVTRGTFERQMALLKKRFHVLSVEQLASHLERKVPFPDASVVITFDDGWRDSYTNALPVLRRHGLPALIFVPAAFVGTRRLFWQESLVHLLLTAASRAADDEPLRRRLSALLSGPGLDEVLDLPEPGRRAAAIATVARLKAQPSTAPRRLMDTLAAELNVATTGLSEVDGFIGWDELHEMSRSGIAFGGHGVDHLLLTQASGEDVDREVLGSRAFLEERAGAPIATFSYPNGYVDPSIVERVRRAGFRLGFTARRGLLECQDDPLTIGRLNIHEGPTGSNPMFMARLIGLF